MNNQYQIYAYIIPGTPYVRHRGCVRIHIFIRIVQVIAWYLKIPYILVHMYGTLVYSAWYQVVPACNSSYGWKLPGN